MIRYLSGFVLFVSTLLGSCANESNSDSGYPGTAPEPITAVEHAVGVEGVRLWFSINNIDSLYSDSLISASEKDSVMIFIDSLGAYYDYFVKLEREMVSQVEGISIDVVDTFALWSMKHQQDLIEYDDSQLNAIGAMLRSIADAKELIPMALRQPYNGHLFLVGQGYNTNHDTLVSWERLNFQDRRMAELLVIYPSVRLRIAMYENALLGDVAGAAYKRKFTK